MVGARPAICGLDQYRFGRNAPKFRNLIRFSSESPIIQSDRLDHPKSMTAPLLSVLIPNYNHGQYLQKCFVGLLAQTFSDFEILITDDGSTDGSPTLIAEYAARDSRFKPNYFPSN